MGRTFIFLLWLKSWRCTTCIYRYEFIQVSVCSCGCLISVRYCVCPMEAWVYVTFCSVPVWRGDGCVVLSIRLRLGAFHSEVWSLYPSEHGGFQSSLREGQKQGENWTLRTVLMLNFTEMPVAALPFAHPLSAALQKPPGPSVSRYRNLGIWGN